MPDHHGDRGPEDTLDVGVPLERGVGRADLDVRTPCHPSLVSEQVLDHPDEFRIAGKSLDGGCERVRHPMQTLAGHVGDGLREPRRVIADVADQAWIRK